MCAKIDFSAVFMIKLLIFADPDSVKNLKVELGPDPTTQLSLTWDSPNGNGNRIKVIWKILFKLL